MTELTPQDRLQPSLLDRLTDNEPQKRTESRSQRVLSMSQLRECVRRDLAWLLNTSPISQTQSLESYPETARSVVNYGVDDLAGRNIRRRDVGDIERSVRRAILNFEPRILPKTLRVQAIVSEEEMSRHALTFLIEGDLWAEPLPQQLFLKTEVDLETGASNIIEFG
jgi:type VI secretion system protein ImpF